MTELSVFEKTDYLMTKFVLSVLMAEPPLLPSMNTRSRMATAADSRLMMPPETTWFFSKRTSVSLTSL